ncbi:siderophore-interacting protein [Larsenimonas salina]|uniref:siderophore-interacting protein n=1 Tax=Larsenimonas salina TaxID=1295565 RepID=UPI0020748293|nr:siderophore-interacting protein [Larsenimonas salina]MCM5704599.1 siderophore-interacting protein [Larsenimonas salina]
MTDRKKPAPRTLELLDRVRLTPNMLRLTLGGEGMAEFPETDQSGGYVKLMIEQGNERPTAVRTYTVRAQRPEAIDVDVVLHKDHGPASHWAVTAELGARLSVGGPGPKKTVDTEADWCLLAADMTALPALAVNLETMPETMTGAAFIEVTSRDDIQTLEAPAGIELHWVVNPTPGVEAEASPLVEAVTAWPWPETGRGFVWGACEFSSMRALRHYVKQVRGLDRRQLYISSYWKNGLAEDGHKVVKQDDAEQDARSV